MRLSRRRTLAGVAGQSGDVLAERQRLRPILSMHPWRPAAWRMPPAPNRT